MKRYFLWYIIIFVILFSSSYRFLYIEQLKKRTYIRFTPQNCCNGADRVAITIRPAHAKGIDEILIKDIFGSNLCNINFDHAYAESVNRKMFTGTMPRAKCTGRMYAEIFYRNGTVIKKSVSFDCSRRSLLNCPQDIRQKGKLIEWQEIRDVLFYKVDVYNEKKEKIYSKTHIHSPRFVIPPDISAHSLSITAVGHTWNEQSKSVAIIDMAEYSQAAIHMKTRAYIMIKGGNFFLATEAVVTDRPQAITVQHISLIPKSVVLEWDERRQCFFSLIPIPYFPNGDIHNVRFELTMGERILIAEESVKANFSIDSIESHTLVYDGEDLLTDGAWRKNQKGYTGLDIFLSDTFRWRIYPRKAGEFDLSKFGLSPRKPYRALLFWQDKPSDAFNIRMYAEPFYFVYKPKG